MEKQDSRRRGFGPGAASLLLALLLASGPALAEVLQYGDGVAEGKRSIGGGGHLIMLEAAKDGLWLNRIEMFGSRYGTAEAPDEDFHVYVVDGERHLLRQIALPYLLWQRGDSYWRALPLPPLKVPQKFGIGLAFHAHQTKGVYVGTDTVPASHSYSWLPGEEGKPLENADWMVRVTVAEAAEGDPQATDLVVRSNGEAFFDRVLGASGEPLMVDLAGHGKLPKSELATIRLGAITSPTPGEAVIVLLNGMRIEGQIVAMDDKVVRLRVGGAEREIARSDLARIDFR